MNTGLHIERRSGYADKMRAYRILVDGVEVARIKPDSTVDVPLAPGSHLIEARIDWCAARPLTVDVAQGQRLRIGVRNRLGAWAALWAITFGRGSYLILERLD